MPQCRTCTCLVPRGVTKCWSCTREGENTLRRANDSYHISLRDEERASYERWAHNFYTLTGGKMKIPPRLYDDMKKGGVDMRYIEADPKLEAAGGEWDK